MGPTALQQAEVDEKQAKAKMWEALALLFTKGVELLEVAKTDLIESGTRRR